MRTGGDAREGNWSQPAPVLNGRETANARTPGAQAGERRRSQGEVQGPRKRGVKKVARRPSKTKKEGSGRQIQQRGREREKH